MAFLNLPLWTPTNSTNTTIKGYNLNLYRFLRKTTSPDGTIFQLQLSGHIERPEEDVTIDYIGETERNTEYGLMVDDTTAYALGTSVTPFIESSITAVPAVDAINPNIPYQVSELNADTIRFAYSVLDSGPTNVDWVLPSEANRDTIIGELTIVSAGF